MHFSQQSLQDYVDCPRRYQLRYLLMKPWPAILSPSPYDAELHLQRGAAFHHMMHQYHSGIAASHLSATASGDLILSRWWETYLLHPPVGLPSTCLQPEAVLSAPLASHRLVARLDLLAMEPGSRAVVVDWKTSTRKPTRDDLARRLQTRVYCYLLGEAASHTKGQPSLEAHQVEMVYWFAEFGGATETFRYGLEQHLADRAYLTALADEITSRREAVWPLTPHENHCSCCNYSSLCERHASPAFIEDETDLEAIEADIDVEQIAEVAFW